MGFRPVGAILGAIGLVSSTKQRVSFSYKPLPARGCTNTKMRVCVNWKVVGFWAFEYWLPELNSNRQPTGLQAYP